MIVHHMHAIYCLLSFVVPFRGCARLRGARVGRFAGSTPSRLFIRESIEVSI